MASPQHIDLQLANMEAVDAVVTPDSSQSGSLSMQEGVSASARCQGLSSVPAAHDEKTAEQQSPLVVNAIVPCTPRKPCVAKGDIGWLYSSMVLMQNNQAPEQLSPRRSAKQLAEMLRREPVGVMNSPMLPLPPLTFPSLDAPLAPEGEAPEVVRARERAARARAAAPAKAQAAATAAAAAATAATAAAKLAQNESCCKASASNCKVTSDTNEECGVTSISALPSPSHQSPASSPDAGQRRLVTGKQRDSPCQEIVSMELSRAEASTTSCSDEAVSSNCVPLQSSKMQKEVKSSPKPSDSEEVATPALKQQGPRSHNQAGGRGAAAKKRAGRRDDAQECTQARSSQKKADKQREEQEEAPVDLGDATTPDPPAEVEEQVSTPPKRGRKRAAPPPEQIANSAMTVELDNTKKQRQGDTKVEPTRVSQRARKQRTLQVQHLLGLGEEERGKFLQGLTLAQQMRIAKEMSLAEAGG